MCFNFFQVEICAFNCLIDKDQIVQLLTDIRSETNLYTIIMSPEFNSGLLKDCIRSSFNEMSRSFKNDCMQYHPHINYLKFQPLLKITLFALETNLNTLLEIPSINQYNISQLTQLFSEYNFIKLLKNSMDAVISLMEHMDIVENVCLIYIETKFIEKIFKENLIKMTSYELYIKFSTLCLVFAQFLLQNEKWNSIEFQLCIQCANVILKQKYLWMELNQPEKYTTNLELIFNVVYAITHKLMADTNFVHKYENQNLFKSIDLNNASVQSYKQAVFFAKFIEISTDDNVATLINFGNSCWLKVIFPHFIYFLTFHIILYRYI